MNIDKIENDVINRLYLLSCIPKNVVQKLLEDFLLLTCMNYMDGKNEVIIPGFCNFTFDYKGDEILSDKGRVPVYDIKFHFSDKMLHLLGEIEDLKKNERDCTSIDEILKDKIRKKLKNILEED